jgi:multidrug efflux pump subunit AcrA (membrane-fusion protein)
MIGEGVKGGVRGVKGVNLLLFLLLLACQPAADHKSASLRQEPIVETGELAAVNNHAFILQRYGRYWYEMKITGLLEQGAIVNPGDSVIQLDPTEIQKFILEREATLETEQTNLETLLVNQEISRNEILSNLKSATATFELSKITLESSRFESERTRKIKELEFQQAEITFKKEQRKLELNKIMQQCDLKIQAIRVRQIENEVENARKLIPRLTLRAPVAGVFEIARTWRSGGSLLKVGDEIYTGSKIANIPELKYMKVNTAINENDFLKIHVGQPVAVRLDALSNAVFEGTVSYIGKLCHWNSYDNIKTRQKVFDVEVRILQPDERLKPGMTVSCDFLLK